jgi:hypothetical protein
MLFQTKMYNPLVSAAVQDRKPLQNFNKFFKLIFTFHLGGQESKFVEYVRMLQCLKFVKNVTNTAISLPVSVQGNSLGVVYIA